jgi:hypothetical protein
MKTKVKVEKGVVLKIKIIHLNDLNAPVLDNRGFSCLTGMY